jgi:DNA topoisomerase-1
MVCTFLTKEFEQIMDYKFTADVEGMLDDIAEGKKVWYKVVREVYEVFNPIIDRLALTIKAAKTTGDKGVASNVIELGVHPKLGVPIIICKTRYGMAICFNHENKDERLYASITEAPESVTLADAISKINILGEHPTLGGFIVLNKKKGYYLTHKKKHYALANYNGGDAASIKLEEAVAIIDAGGCGKAEREADPKERVISDDWVIKKGPYGYYLKYKGDRNVKIPKKLLDKLEVLKVEDCLPLLEVKPKAGKATGKANVNVNDKVKVKKATKVPKEPKVQPKEPKKENKAKK